MRALDRLRDRAAGLTCSCLFLPSRPPLAAAKGSGGGAFCWVPSSTEERTKLGRKKRRKRRRRSREPELELRYAQGAKPAIVRVVVAAAAAAAASKLFFCQLVQTGSLTT